MGPPRVPTYYNFAWGGLTPPDPPYFAQAAGHIVFKLELLSIRLLNTCTDSIPVTITAKSSVDIPSSLESYNDDRCRAFLFASDLAERENNR